MAHAERSRKLHCSVTYNERYAEVTKHAVHTARLPASDLLKYPLDVHPAREARGRVMEIRDTDLRRKHRLEVPVTTSDESKRGSVLREEAKIS